MNIITAARIATNECETRDSFHNAIDLLVTVTRKGREPLAVSGDAIRKGATPTERARASRVNVWAGVQS